MTGTFKKLNFKSQDPVLILHAPQSFSSQIAAMKPETEIHSSPKKGQKYGFALAFGETRADIEKAGRTVTPLLDGDAVCWFAYPKGTSKKFKSDLTREVMWDALGAFGVRPVRQIAIDDDWSALRFRKAQYVKA